VWFCYSGIRAAAEKYLREMYTIVKADCVRGEAIGSIHSRGIAVRYAKRSGKLGRAEVGRDVECRVRVIY